MSHVDEEKKELEKEVNCLVCLAVKLSESNEDRLMCKMGMNYQLY